MTEKRNVTRLLQLFLVSALLVSLASTATADIPKKGVVPGGVSYRQNPCADYVSRAGPLTGVILSPMVAGGGVGLAVAGTERRQDGSLTKAGKGMLAGGIVMAVTGLVAAIVSGKRLQKRNERRRQQQLLGCPPY